MGATELTMPDKSSLQQERIAYVPDVPPVLQAEHVSMKIGSETTAAADSDAIKEKFPLLYGQPVVTFEQTEVVPDAVSPLKIGVVLSGGQAPGGHNVIAGLFDALKKINPDSQLIGFVNGPGGIVDNKTMPITSELLAKYRNT